MNNMDDTPNYAAYSVEELEDALTNIDQSTYPDRAQAILVELEKRKESVKEAEQSATPISRKSNVIFHGNGKEYFSIWIVNLLLTIVTLGIYSAWATVRNNRYFYSNTEIDGHRFSYLAQPLQILVGRVIGVLLFAVYFLAVSFSPTIAFFVMIAIFLLVPVLVCLGASFRMRMTGYRNIRFNFTKNYGRAYVVFVGYALIGMISFGLLYPWVLKKIDEFLYSHVTYGDRKLNPKLQTGDYYSAAILAGVAAFAIAIASSFTIVMFSSMLVEEGSEQGGFLGMVITFAMYAVLLVVSSSIYQAMIRNHIYNSTEIEGVATFNSDVSIGGLMQLRFTNLLMLIVSLGFLMPWIKVRTIKFYADATEINIQEGAERVLADNSQTGNAIGEEVAGVFDVDIAIG